MLCIQAVINAGGRVEPEEKKSESDEDLSSTKEGERGDTTGSVTSLESEESFTSEEITVDSVVPLMSEEEEGDSNIKKEEADSDIKELTRRHKLRLLVSKGSVIVVSCAVLLVGVVLAAVLHHDYSSCEPEEVSVSAVMTSTASVYSTSSVVTSIPGPLPTPTSSVF